MLVILTLLPVSTAGAAGRAGTLDRSFGGGSAVRGFGTLPGRGGVVETAPMPDGGFVVATTRGSIGRYLADGSLDREFGEDGYLVGAKAGQIATTADGRIYALSSAEANAARLARFLPDSSPDRSFGRDGTVELDPVSPFEEMLATPEGAVFLIGTELRRERDPVVEATRVGPGGRVDGTYGRRGVARIDLPHVTGEGFAFALDGERLTFVAGAGTYVEGSAILRRKILVGRFDPDGVADPFFPAPITLPGDALGAAPTGIAPGPGDGVTVIAGASFAHLSADGALEPGGSSDPASLEKLTAERSFSSFATQPDGKIVIGGHTVDEGPSRLVLARLDPDGSLDPTFGGDGSGVVTTGVAAEGGSPRLIVLSDGDLLLGGEKDGVGQSVAAVRFTSDGVPVPGFAAAGVLSASPVAYSDDAVYALTALPGGGVVAVGTAGGRVLVTRYEEDGRPAPGFAAGGFFRAEPATDSRPEEGTAIARLPDGRFLVGAASPKGASLLMLAPDGRPVPSFGGDGTVSLGDLERVDTIATTAGGAILVAGSSGEPCHFLVERLAPGGGVDRSFGTGEGATQIGGPCYDGRAIDLLQRPGGGLVVAIEGTATIRELSADGRRRARVSARGECEGRVPRPLGAIALDAGGRLIVGGSLHHRLGLVRLDRDGALDCTFGRNGLATREVGRRARVTGLAVEPDGRILASGIATVGPPSARLGPTAVIARFLPDGAVDEGFGRRGVWTGRREGSALDSLALAGGNTAFAGGWSITEGDRNLLLVKVHR